MSGVLGPRENFSTALPQSCALSFQQGKLLSPLGVNGLTVKTKLRNIPRNRHRKKREMFPHN